jgi:hypothetical protein
MYNNVQCILHIVYTSSLVPICLFYSSGFHLHVYIVLHASSLFQFASSIALASTYMYIVLHCIHLEFVPVCLIYSSGFHMHVYIVLHCIYTSSLFQFASSIALASTCTYIVLHIMHQIEAFTELQAK